MVDWRKPILSKIEGDHGYSFNLSLSLFDKNHFVSSSNLGRYSFLKNIRAQMYTDWRDESTYCFAFSPANTRKMHEISKHRNFFVTALVLDRLGEVGDLILRWYAATGGRMIAWVSLEMNPRVFRRLQSERIFRYRFRVRMPSSGDWHLQTC